MDDRPSEQHDIVELGPEYVQNPYPFYARMRDQPVRRVAMPSGSLVWLVTRYADVRAVLADPRLCKDRSKLGVRAAAHESSALAVRGANMLEKDPPDHERLRRLVSKAFTPGRIAALRPRIAEITADILDAMERRAADGNISDLIEEFAFPLPVRVICELLGVPYEDRDAFRVWTHTLLGGTPRSSEQTQSAATAMYEYNRRLLASKRAAPADDMLSALVQAHDEGDRLDEGELLAMISLLLIAGHDTTVNLLGSGMFALLTHPAELARLRADPALLPAAVEEMLRFGNPVNHTTARFAAEPLEIDGVHIPRGDPVLAAISSANRDPGHFEEPDTLDLGRDARRHMAFGHGIHYCLGAPLARAEGEIAFGSLLERCGDITLAAPAQSLRYRPGTFIRGLQTLPVRLRP